MGNATRAGGTTDRLGPGLLLVACLALLLLPAVLRGGWALDDRELLFGNPVTSGALPWYAALGRDYFHHMADSGQWRPLASLSLRVDQQVFGEWVTGYHLSNWLLQVGVIGLAFALLRELGVCGRGTRFGLIVFALHPALVDSVVWISGRTSMLSALFPLAGLVVSCRWSALGKSASLRALPAALGLLAGLLCKEDAVVFALLLPLVAARRSRADGRAAAVAAAVVLLLWCGGRTLALGAPLPAATSPVLAAASLSTRLCVGGAAILEGLQLVFVPISYPPQYRLDFLLARFGELPPKLFALLGWTLLSTPFAVALLWRRKRSSVTLISSVLAALAFLPVTQIVPLGEVFAPRFLYLPLLFAIPLIGRAALLLIPERAQNAACLILALVLAGAFFQRAGVYSDRAAWRAEVLRHMPGDVPSWNDLGLIREERGDISAARTAWRRAIELDPDYSRSWSNLGRLQLEQGELEAAESSLREALRAGPRNPVARVNLASLLAKTGRHGEAVGLYTEATRLAPGLAPAWRGQAQALFELGRVDDASQAIARALELDPGDRTAQALLRRIEGR